MSVACVPAKPAEESAVRPCRNVLAAVDLEADGALALPYAYSVVADGGTVHLVHVVKPSAGPDPTIGGLLNLSATENEIAEQTAGAPARLRTLVPAGAAARAIATELHVMQHEDPAVGICQVAEAANAEIVCKGSHVRPGAVARALGSVALGVLQHCRRPVPVAWPRPG